MAFASRMMVVRFSERRFATVFHQRASRMVQCSSISPLSSHAHCPAILLTTGAFFQPPCRVDAGYSEEILTDQPEILRTGRADHPWRVGAWCGAR